MSLWQDISNKSFSQKTKKRFARFSVGRFEKEPITFSLQGKKLTIKSGVFDQPELIEIISLLNRKAKVDGKFITKSELPFDSEFDKKRKAYVYHINGEIDLQTLVNSHGYFLGEIEFPQGNLITKKTLPKISKQDPNFAKLTLKLDSDVERIVKEVYVLKPDIPLSGKINYCIFVDSIDIPDNVQPNEDVREMAKRKGKIERKIDLKVYYEEVLEFEI